MPHIMIDAMVNTKNGISVTKENPFPGMNPWMETVWSDMNTRMIGYIADELSTELPEDLVARAEENVALCSPSEAGSQRKTDVGVIEPEDWKKGSRPVWTPVDDQEPNGRVTEPVLVMMEEVTERWIEIRTAKGKLITVIELTSPANKT